MNLLFSLPLSVLSPCALGMRAPKLFNAGLALLVLAFLALAPVVRAQDEDEPLSLRHYAAPTQEAKPALTLPPEARTATPLGVENDLAIVPFKGVTQQANAGIVYKKIHQLFQVRGFRMVARPAVESAIKKMGVLTPEAVMLQDCDKLAATVSCRYLLSGGIKVGVEDASFSSAGSFVNGARILTGGFAGLAAGASVPLLAGGMALSLLGGFSNSAHAQLECHIYDTVAHKVIWMGSETASETQTFMAPFRNTKKIQDQALDRSIEKLFSPVMAKLEKVTSGPKTFAAEEETADDAGVEEVRQARDGLSANQRPGKGGPQVD